MSELEQRLRKAMKQAVERHFRFYTVWSSRGDCNCPHPVTYHPEDGHGWEEEKLFLEIDPDTGKAIFDDGDVEEDPIEALCRLFESLPEIKERDLIGKEAK